MCLVGLIHLAEKSPQVGVTIFDHAQVLSLGLVEDRLSDEFDLAPPLRTLVIRHFVFPLIASSSMKTDEPTVEDAIPSGSLQFDCGQTQTNESGDHLIVDGDTVDDDLPRLCVQVPVLDGLIEAILMEQPTHSELRFLHFTNPCVDLNSRIE